MTIGRSKIPCGEQVHAHTSQIFAASPAWSKHVVHAQQHVLIPRLSARTIHKLEDDALKEIYHFIVQPSSPGGRELSPKQEEKETSAHCPRRWIRQPYGKFFNRFPKGRNRAPLLQTSADREFSFEHSGNLFSLALGTDSSFFDG